jgi:outer membrane protein
MKQLFCLIVLISFHVVAAGADAEGFETISLDRAHEMAVRNAPRITLAQLQSLASQDQIAIARAAYLPNLTGNANVVRADGDNTRIGAGGINNPSIFDRAAVGVSVSQLITDFGRTTNQIAAARFHALADDQGAKAAIEQVLLDVDLAYFQTLQRQAMLAVAHKTVENRQLLVERIASMVANKLKSELDLSVANVALDAGRMMEARIGNELKTGQLTLATLLGYDAPQPFRLVDIPLPGKNTVTPEKLVAQACSINPGIMRLRIEIDAAQKSLAAENAADAPSISAVGMMGRILDHDDRLPDNYAAGAINLSIPLYAGGMIAARQHRAETELHAAQARLHLAEDELARDVRIAITNVDYAYEQMEMADRLLHQASQAYDLARSRFGLGLDSITDVSQADLNQTDAAMSASTAKQECLLRRAILDHLLGSTLPDVRSLSSTKG